MKYSVDEVPWDIVKDTLAAYDIHFRILYGLDTVILNQMGVETTKEFREVILPELVKRGLCPMNEDGTPIWDVENLDKVGGLNNIDASSKFFALKRAYAQLEAREKESK